MRVNRNLQYTLFLLNLTLFPRRGEPFARRASGQENTVSTVGIDEDTIKKYIQDQWKNDQFYDGLQLDLRWD